MSTTREVKLDPIEATLRDAQMCYDEALRYGNPGDVSRARRFLKEAKQATEKQVYCFSTEPSFGKRPVA